MAQYVLSPRAKKDIEEIWEYSNGYWGADQAERYIRTLQEAVEMIAANPQRGRSCDDVRRGYRKYAVGSHLIFFRSAVSGIHVVRILHQRMDFDRHI